MQQIDIIRHKMKLLNKPEIIQEEITMLVDQVRYPHLTCTIPGRLRYLPVQVALDEPVDIDYHKKFDWETEEFKFSGCRIVHVLKTEDGDNNPVITGTMTYNYFTKKEMI